MATTGHTNNYTLGRGEVYFDRFESDGVTTTGRRYLGNTPSFALTVSSEKLDHYSSDGGIRVKDESIVLETSMTGSLSCDHVSLENLALFFFGTSSTVTQTVIGSATTEDIEVEAGLFYQVGVTLARPQGLRDITVASVEVISPSATAVAGTDYIVDTERGVIEILPGALFPAGARKTVTVTYTAAAASYDQVISGTSPVQGALFLKATNPVGTVRDFFMPKVELTPNGEYNLKGEDWSVMQFSVEVLKKGSLASLYVNGMPA